ncbi:hypothetical protein [Streptomyces sp. SYP-A7185]|uniref:hypothetical protein n=1 Tax=Streptomyces sp. SYP-A7185 TaxID=3040076 RepID=UPI0038F5E4C2
MARTALGAASAAVGVFEVPAEDSAYELTLSTRKIGSNHAGATGRQVWLRSEPTDANGSSVTQTVARAYDVR